MPRGVAVRPHSHATGFAVCGEMLNFAAELRQVCAMIEKKAKESCSMRVGGDGRETSIEAVAKGERDNVLIDKLLRVWGASVRATHHFLAEADVVRLAPQAEVALRQVETLWVVADNREPVGFMGVQERKIEMLFLHPGYFRRGLGRELVRRALDRLGVEYVDVNEQNPGAARFYERMGFSVFRRNERDSGGNPFPILEMRR